MKANRLVLTVLLLVTAAVFQLPAQQNEADRKVLAEIRAGADKGDAKAQYELGRAFFSGTLGVAKDEAEAVKWFRKAAEQNVAAERQRNRDARAHWRVQRGVHSRLRPKTGAPKVTTALPPTRDRRYFSNPDGFNFLKPITL